MMGGMEHGSHGNKNSRMNPGIKEVLVSNYSLVAEFPSPELNGQINYTLNIINRETKQIIDSAEVWFITGDENKQGEFSQTKLNQNLTGEYSVSYKFENEDSKLIGFKILSINGEHFQIPIEIFIEQQAMMDHHGEHSGIMGYMPYMIGGVVMMGGMMFLLMSR